MRIIIALALPLLFLTACNSVEKHRAGIEGLATQWDEATAQVTEFAGTLQSEQSSFTQSLSTLEVNEEMLAKVKDAAKKEELSASFASLQSSGASFASLSAEVSNFVSTWTEKAAEVNALKEGLASGKLEGDVPAKIAELTTLVTDATTKLGTWKEQFDAAKAAVSTQQASYQGMVNELFPNM
jgi:chromosome segregation ATPase